jgi:hypothetical protein
VSGLQRPDGRTAVAAARGGAAAAGQRFAEDLVAQLAEFWGGRTSATEPARGEDQVDLPLIRAGLDQVSDAINPYWDVVRWLPRWPFSGEPCANPHIPGFPALLGIKDRLRQLFAWAIPSPGDVGWIADTLHGNGASAVTEVGAGAGYWAWQLTQAGIQVDASDANPPAQAYAPVQREVAATAAASAGVRALLLAWPPPEDPMAADALRSFPGDLLVYCGEEVTGCTASDEFFDVLDEEWEPIGTSPHHVTWESCDDVLAVWRRRN